MVKETELYDVLDLAPTASDEDIKKAYKRQALRWHPDKHQNNSEAAEKFKEISNAYETLKDPQKREIYDKFGKVGLSERGGAGEGGMGGMSAADIFSQFFGNSAGNFFSQATASREARTENLNHQVGVSLKELYNGKTTRLSIRKHFLCKQCNGEGTRSGKSATKCIKCEGKGSVMFIRQMGPMVVQQQAACDACQGKGESIVQEDRCTTCNGKKVCNDSVIREIKIEPGMKYGDRIVLQGEADEAPHAKPGDIIITLIPKNNETEKFERVDIKDLCIKIKITLKEALCGFEKTILHLDGHPILLKRSQKVTGPGDFDKLKGEGMPIHKMEGYRGDLYVYYSVVFPSFDEISNIQTELGNLLP